MQLGSFNKPIFEPLKLTAKLIFEKIDQTQIYFKYLGYYPKDHKSYYSVFIKEKTPSFKFYVNRNWILTYKCFSTGKSGDCINLVCEIFGLTIKEALIKITKDFKLIDDEGKIDNAKENISIQETIENTNLCIRDDAKIEVILFNHIPNSYLKYWEQFSISKSTLDFYYPEVLPAQQVWINDRLYAKYKDYSPIIRIKTYEEYKIYIPYEIKERKFRTTFHRKIIFGYKQLDKFGEILIISKAVKDVIIWRELGYNSITLNCESAKLWKELLDHLYSRYKYIIVCLDNDNQGITTMLEYSKEWNLPFIILPTLEEEQCKDLGEIIFCLKKIETKILVNNLINEVIKKVNKNK